MSERSDLFYYKFLCFTDAYKLYISTSLKNKIQILSYNKDPLKLDLKSNFKGLSQIPVFLMYF